MEGLDLGCALKHSDVQGFDLGNMLWLTDLQRNLDIIYAFSVLSSTWRVVRVQSL
jgi:hypothetical protein